MSIDTTPYVGVPYVENGHSWEGWACWPMVCAVYKRELGILLDPWDTVDSRDGPGIAVAAVEEATHWIPIERGHERCFDVVLLRENGRPGHVGVVTSPPYFLHARRGAGTCVATYARRAANSWYYKIIGFYRYPALAARTLP